RPSASSVPPKSNNIARTGVADSCTTYCIAKVTTRQADVGLSAVQSDVCEGVDRATVRGAGRARAEGGQRGARGVRAVQSDIRLGSPIQCFDAVAARRQLWQERIDLDERALGGGAIDVARIRPRFQSAQHRLR